MNFKNTENSLYSLYRNVQRSPFLYLQPDYHLFIYQDASQWAASLR